MLDVPNFFWDSEPTLHPLYIAVRGEFHALTTLPPGLQRLAHASIIRSSIDLKSLTAEYLEIKPRVQALNERCRVFLDLAEILSDSIADQKMSSK